MYTHSRTLSSLFQVFFFFNENTQKAAQRFCELRRPLKVGRELLNYAKFLPPVETRWAKKNNLAPPPAKETGVSLLARVQAGQLLHRPGGRRTRGGRRARKNTTNLISALALKLHGAVICISAAHLAGTKDKTRALAVKPFAPYRIASLRLFERERETVKYAGNLGNNSKKKKKKCERIRQEHLAGRLSVLKAVCQVTAAVLCLAN